MMVLTVKRIRDGGCGRFVRLGMLALADLHRAPDVHHGSGSPSASRLHRGHICAAVGQRQVK